MGRSCDCGGGLDGFAGGVAGREGYLEVIAASVGVEVEEFADDIESADEAAFHGFRVHFGEGDATLGDDGFVPVVGAGYGEFDAFEPVAEAAAFFAGDLVEAFVIFYM